MAKSNLTHLLNVMGCVARIAVFIAILLSLGSKAEPVSVTVYYNMVCEHSISFITQILYPAWKALSGDVQVDFIQYGNTETTLLRDDSWKQQCVNGLEVCNDNKEIACAMEVLQDNRTLQMEYIYCFLNSTRTGPKCSEELNINFNNINECKEGEHGLQLVLELGKRTKSLIPPIKGFPWIIFNGVYNRESHIRSWMNLTAVLCGKIKDPKPQTCIG